MYGVGRVVKAGISSNMSVLSLVNISDLFRLLAYISFFKVISRQVWWFMLIISALRKWGAAWAI
jgi:hypothetical protein